jgi:hypothetical protein
MKTLKNNFSILLKRLLLLSVFLGFSTILVCAQNNAQFISLSAPDQVVIGQTFSVSIAMKNTGSTSWTSGGTNPYRLGSQNPSDNIYWGRSRVELPTTPITYGTTVNFTFNVTAPLIPGTYNFQWRMVQEQIAWFGDFTVNKVITVVATQNNSQFVSMTVPSSVVVGETFQASITFKNNGGTSWTSGGTNPYRLGTVNDPWNLWNTIRVELPTSPINSGQNVTFTFNCIAPSTAGNYNFQWRMVQELIEWFGPTSTNAVIKVVPHNSSEFISMTVPSTVVAGQTFSASVRFKNNGSNQWTSGGTNPYRLGTENDPWNLWTIIRVELPSSPIGHDQIAEFNFTCTAPTTTGTYNFKWKMVKELIEWFGESTPSMTVSVTQPTNNSEFISQTVQTVLSPGQTFNASFIFKNTGTSIWMPNGDHSWWLGSEKPQDNNIWGTNRAGMVETTVSKDQTYTFNSTFTAPTQDGEYYFQWKMLQNYVEWFGDKTPLKIIKVGTIIDDAEFISQTVPTSLYCNTQFTATLIFKNTGNSIWKKGTYCLASENPPNNTNWGTNRIELQNDVIPGASGTFTATLTSPSTTGNYPFQWRLSMGGDSRFGEISDGVLVHVYKYYNSQYLGAIPNFPSSVSAGGSFTVTLRFLNTGNEPWVNANLNLTVSGGWYTGSNLVSAAKGAIGTINLTFHAMNMIGMSTMWIRGQLSGPEGLFGDSFNVWVDIYPNGTGTKPGTNALSIDENQSNIEDIIVYPNPTSDVVYINLPNNNEVNLIKIFDVTGKVIYSNEYKNIEKIEINVSNFKKGIYFISVNNQTKTFQKKLIVN